MSTSKWQQGDSLCQCLWQFHDPGRGHWGRQNHEVRAGLRTWVLAWRAARGGNLSSFMSVNHLFQWAAGLHCPSTRPFILVLLMPGPCPAWAQLSCSPSSAQWNSPTWAPACLSYFIPTCGTKHPSLHKQSVLNLFKAPRGMEKASKKNEM